MDTIRNIAMMIRQIIRLLVLLRSHGNDEGVGREYFDFVVDGSDEYAGDKCFDAMRLALEI